MYILNNRTNVNLDSNQVIPNPAGATMNIWCRGNTAGTNQLKNGAVKSDRIFLVIDVKGDWGRINFNQF